MKLVWILAGVAACAVAGTVPYHDVPSKPVDPEFVARQKKVLSFLGQLNPQAEYYKVGMNYDIESNIDAYTNKKAVEKFLYLYKKGFLPNYQPFSVFYEDMREEAIVLFYLFYYAKDFETFYKTACYARVHFNEGLFYYTFTIAIIHRSDCRGLVLPAGYEVIPQFYVDSQVINKIYHFKMHNGTYNTEMASYYGTTQQSDYYVYYANYSRPTAYNNYEYQLSYFTEDIGLNSFYFYFHAWFPFWMEGDYFGSMKEHRGEGFYYFYQKLLARYYLERLSNGFGKIPEFSWYQPFETGYSPALSYYYPFAQRNNYHYMQSPYNVKYTEYIDAYEKTFLQYLENGNFKAYNQEVDFRNYKAINFVGNYWQCNADLYAKSVPRNYYRSYELTACHLLCASPEQNEKYDIVPGALEHYSSSLRDPAFYQLYKRILGYFLQYKAYLKPYSQQDLQISGVRIKDVTVDPLKTYFDEYNFDVTMSVSLSSEEAKSSGKAHKVRQPRLNHKPFTVHIQVKSDVEFDAVVKIFLGPKYDSNGFPISLENNWMNFIELDAFVYKMTKGQISIERNSYDFYFFGNDAASIPEIYKYLDQGQVPANMTSESNFFPNRLMLPKGTKGGFPFQIFAYIYQYQPAAEDNHFTKHFALDNKPFGYPFDRPVDEFTFTQPNMYFKDVYIYHEGKEYPFHQNGVFKH